MRPAARPLSLPLPRGTRVCARPGRGHGAAAGHADRSPREGGVCRRWRRRAEAFRVGPRLPPAVTQVVAGRRRLCGGQEVWLRAPRPHVRPVPWPALEGRPSIFPPLPPTRRRRGVGRAAGAQCPPPSGRGSWRREEGPQDRTRRSTRTLRGRPDLPVAPCLLLRGLESQSQPGVKRAKAYFGSKEGKIFPQGTELPWDCGKSLTLRT